ncbi:MAG: HPF/RaiA family ribosome-associated protein [Deltaproteobacteria bacterium]|nr:HPF/RaiA family ribosome-associated protein [Deltaproteobacteria bacterium]MDQ3300544.1 HPF/RaiA family ribosome-associated protein [Myxococcota bacterium]
MQIQIRHDGNTPGDRNQRISGIIEDVLARHSDQITTVEVHLADEDGPKNADGAIRCTIEVRLAGRKPTAVTHHASDVMSAVDQAAEKVLRALDHQLDRSRDFTTGEGSR